MVYEGSNPSLRTDQSMNRFYIGIIAGIVSALAYIIYFRSILKGETKPSRVTWWIWTFMGAIMASSYYASGARDSMWSPIVEFIGPFLTALLAIKYGEGSRADKTDKICFLGGIISIILWALTGNPVVALIFNLTIDFFAVVPTIKKSYLRPQNESFWAWSGTGLGDFLNLLAAGTTSFAIVIYPAWMLFVDLIIIGLLGFRSKIIPRPPASDERGF